MTPLVFEQPDLSVRTLAEGEGSVLAGNGCDLWLIDLDALVAYAGHWYEQLLSSEERDRADRFATDLLRQRFVVSRGSLRLLLARYVTERARKLVFAHGAHGKPFLTGSERPLFNLSHSMRIMALAVSRCPVGIDVEQCKPPADFDLLLDRFLSESELQWVTKLSDVWRARAFFQFWCLKEATTKATGEGLTRSLRNIEVRFAEQTMLSCDVFDRATGTQYLTARSFGVRQGYTAALVCASRLSPISLRWVTP